MRILKYDSRLLPLISPFHLGFTMENLQAIYISLSLYLRSYTNPFVNNLFVTARL